MPLYSFPPCVNANTRLLIIGSMPGAASLAAGEYYAYKYNLFWRFMFEILAAGRTPLDYKDKLNTLLANGIGLWDTLACCERKGSLDTAICYPIPNDFPTLFKSFPAIHTLLFNGQAAALYFKRAFNGFLDKRFFVLPSTSPANASLSYEAKINRWRNTLREALEILPQ